MQPDADRACRLPEQRRDLLARQPVHVVQEHRAPLLGREHVDRALHALPDLPRLDELLWRRLVAEACGNTAAAGRIGERQRPVAAAAEPHLRQVQRDPIDPAREPLRVAKPLEAEIGLQHRLLRQVLGFGLVAEQAAGERLEPRAVAVDELAEGAVVSGEARRHELAVLATNLHCHIVAAAARRVTNFCSCPPPPLQFGAATSPAAREALDWAGQTRAEMVDLKFCDLLGTWQHVTLPIAAFDESAFDEGLGFDGVSYELASNRAHYAVDSPEGHWNSGKPGLGYTVREKEGYFPPAPHDTLHDLRSRMVLTLERLGIPCEFHHHEVASSGQCEIDLRFQSLTRMGDQVLLYKYVVKNTARAAGKTVTFMP